MTRTAFLALMLVPALSAWAQDNGSLRARELFYSAPPAKSAQPPAPVAAANSQAPAEPVRAAKKVSKPAPAAAANNAPQVAAAKATPAQPSPMQNVTEKAPEAVPLGMRYSVLRRNNNGKFDEVDADTTFHSGDRIRLEVESNTSGYLYVVAQGSSGNWQVLFPSKEVAGGSNLVHRGESRQVPSGERGQFVFDEQAGAEKIFLVLTRQPENNLEKLIYSMRAPTKDSNEPARVMMAQASVGDDVISRIRNQMSARDLVFEKVENETVAQEKGGARLETAAYVVNPSIAPEARLVVDLKLTHR